MGDRHATHGIRGLHVLLAVLTLVACLPGLVVAEPRAQDNPYLKIEPELLAELAKDEAPGYLVYLREYPDLSAAYEMGWFERGRFVVSALQTAARRSQARLLERLEDQNVAYQAFWIDNVVAVQGSPAALLFEVAALPEVEIVRAERKQFIIPPLVGSSVAACPQGIEPNISHVMAPNVWELGYTGQGIVVAHIDTGVRYTHEAMVGQYRGNLGAGAFDHNFNWLDTISASPVPNDSYGHGSHTMGIMLGEAPASSHTGMAPDAQWIACKACDLGSGCPNAALLTCAQWIVAPYAIGHPAAPDADQRPHLVNNSWGGCAQAYDGWFQGAVDAWQAAGIYPLFANGNASNCGYPYPPGCNTVVNPARYGNVTAVGATGQSDGAYASYSTWGPTDSLDTVNPGGYPCLKPQVVAPGTNICSSLNGSDSQYAIWGGTSMSTPHVAGLVALMWQAAPCLVGDYATTETIIEQTATRLPYHTTCGCEGLSDVPNCATGWGEIDALAAVTASIAQCQAQWGRLEGHIHALDGAEPLAGATVLAFPHGDISPQYRGVTGPGGHYLLSLPGGLYDLVALHSGFGYEKTAGITILSGLTTTQDFYLVDYEQWCAEYGCWYFPLMKMKH